MKTQAAMGILLLALCTSATVTAAHAQSKSEGKPSFSGVLDHNLSGVEKEVVPAAEAMPEDKFNFAPAQGEFKGVRTFGQQVKHIAAVNYMLGAALLSEKPPVELGGENGPDKMASKTETVQFLKDSFAYLHKAFNTIDQGNVLGEVPSPFGPNKMVRLNIAVIGISHPYDHYGQMVEYLRMNNIIPPASRNQ